MRSYRSFCVLGSDWMQSYFSYKTSLMAQVTLDSLTVSGLHSVYAFWVVMACGLLGEYERLENNDSIFSTDVSI
jgi:hypothetical protein